MLVFSTPPDTFYSLATRSSRPRSSLACFLYSPEIRTLALCFTTLRPIALPNVKEWGKGSGAVRVISIQKVHGDTRQNGCTKLPFNTRHKSVEGVLLPESPPRVLRDPPFIQCLVTICMPRFSSYGFFGPSRCLIPIPGLTSEYPIYAVCVYVCVYTHIHPHTLPPALKIEKTQTAPLSFPLSKITPPAKQQVLA